MMTVMMMMMSMVVLMTMMMMMMMMMMVMMVMMMVTMTMMMVADCFDDGPLPDGCARRSRDRIDHSNGSMDAHGPRGVCAVRAAASN